MPEASMTAADDTPQWRAQQTSPLAIVSMVCGMVALVLGPLAILAIVFGHIARGQVRRTGEGGRGMATAGLILGYMVLVVGTALAVAFLASLPSQRQPKTSPLPDSAQPRSAGRDQQAVKLQGLFPAEQVDLFRPECGDFASCLRGLPELAGDAHAEGIARVIGLPDGRCQRRDIGGGKGDHESVCGGSRLLRVGGDRGDCSGSHRYRAADRKVARYAHPRRG